MTTVWYLLAPFSDVQMLVPSGQITVGMEIILALNSGSWFGLIQGVRM